MRRSPSAGFTLIELMAVVVVIGILATITMVRYGKVKERAVVASMKSDLRSVAMLQGLFRIQYDDFAGGAVATGQADTTRGGSGTIRFVPSEGNTVAITYRGQDGFSAVATSPGATQVCGIFVGSPGYSPDPAVTEQNTPTCW